MPLTPDDVVQKKFNPTKFREGYDQDEVDDFLDEIVGEFRRLTGENEDLRRQLSQCEGRVSELSRGGATGVAEVPTPTPAEAPASSSGPVAAEAGPADTPAVLATSDSATSDAAASAPGEVSGMLALAQRLHDEHVREGEAQRDRLLAEAQETAGRLVSEAEATQAQTLGDLEEQRSMLERTIDELRGFEREYRSRLKSYLENQLRDLDTKGQVVPTRTPAGGSDGDGSAAAGFPFGGRS